jgi:hypothetical protein
MCPPSTNLLVKHLALRAQSVALGHQAVNLLPALQHALDRLLHQDLGLVELLLDLHDTVGVLGVLVLCEVVLELGPADLAAVLERGDRVLREELVDEPRQDLVRDEAGILAVAYDDAGDALAATVDVEGVRYGFVSLTPVSE